MGKFNAKMMGNEVGNAGIYAQPHSPTGGAINAQASVSRKPDPNKLSSDQIKPSTLAARVSAGNPDRDDIKTTGIETRGNGCAIKGRTARGPLC